MITEIYSYKDRTPENKPQADDFFGKLMLYAGRGYYVINKSDDGTKIQPKMLSLTETIQHLAQRKYTGADSSAKMSTHHASAPEKEVTLTFSSGGTYVGPAIEHLRSTTGKITLSDGSVFEGEVSPMKKGGKVVGVEPSGPGVLTSPKGWKWTGNVEMGGITQDRKGIATFSPLATGTQTWSVKGKEHSITGTYTRIYSKEGILQKSKDLEPLVHKGSSPSYIARLKEYYKSKGLLTTDFEDVFTTGKATLWTLDTHEQKEIETGEATVQPADAKPNVERETINVRGAGELGARLGATKNREKPKGVRFAGGGQGSPQAESPKKGAEIANVHSAEEKKFRGGNYTGSLNKNGHPDGRGTMKYNDGRVYKGAYQEGQMHGQGTMTYPNGKVEKGRWEKGVFKKE